MEIFSHYVGLDVHRRMIAYCVKAADGRIEHEGEMEATRAALQAFGENLVANCALGLEALSVATGFTTP